MTKIQRKIYLDERDWKLLKSKAEDLGFIGRGQLNRLFEKLAKEPIVFLDGNLKAMLKMLDVNIKPPQNDPKHL